MLIHPQFNPIAVQIGSFAVHWYGLMYLVAFAGAAMLGRWRLRLPHVAAQGWNARRLMIYCSISCWALSWADGSDMRCFTKPVFTSIILWRFLKSGKAVCPFMAG